MGRSDVGKVSPPDSGVFVTRGQDLDPGLVRRLFSLELRAARKHVVSRVQAGSRSLVGRSERATL